MEYQINLIQSVLKVDIPKLNKSGINLEPLRKSIEKLKTNPYTTSRAKTGDLKGYRAVDFKRGYRLVFIIDENEKTVIIVSIDSHNEAYKKGMKTEYTILEVLNLKSPEQML